MNFDEKVNCDSCKHGYFKGYSWDGWHNMCGAWRCYLCAERNGYCDDYEEGDVPEGKERDL